MQQQYVHQPQGAVSYFVESDAVSSAAASRAGAAAIPPPPFGDAQLFRQEVVRLPPDVAFEEKRLSRSVLATQRAHAAAAAKAASVPPGVVPVGHTAVPAGAVAGSASRTPAQTPSTASAASASTAATCPASGNDKSLGLGNVNCGVWKWIIIALAIILGLWLIFAFATYLQKRAACQQREADARLQSMWKQEIKQLEPPVPLNNVGGLVDDTGGAGAGNSNVPLSIDDGFGDDEGGQFATIVSKPIALTSSDPSLTMRRPAALLTSTSKLPLAFGSR